MQISALREQLSATGVWSAETGDFHDTLDFCLGRRR